MPKRKGLNSLIPPQDQEEKEAQEEETKTQESITDDMEDNHRPSQTRTEKDYENANNQTSQKRTQNSKNLQKQSKANNKNREEESTKTEDLKETPSPKTKDKEAVFRIEVDKIKPNPYQPRKEYDEQEMKELANSIREIGILQPLVVSRKEEEKPGGGGTKVEYQLISGERRWRAAKRIGLETVPAITKSFKENKDNLSVALIENVQRSDLNPIERARAYARLQDEFNLTQREVATKVGKSRSSVSNSLRLLSLPSKMQEALSEGEINESQARILLSIEDPAEQEEVFKGLKEGNLDTKQAKEIKNKSKNSKTSSNQKTSKRKDNTKKKQKEKFWETKLEEKLSAPVQIKRKGNGGKLIIKFFSKDEWDGIVNRILGPDS